MGQIGLPDIQRPFVWSNAKVRDQFDSMYRGYPVGFFMFWDTGAEAGRNQGLNRYRGRGSLGIGDGPAGQQCLQLPGDFQQRRQLLLAGFARAALMARLDKQRAHLRAE